MRASVWAITALACGTVSLAVLAPRRLVSSIISNVARTLRWKEQLTPSGNRLPQTMHQFIKDNDLKPGRLIIVGDVHGCIDELLQLLAKVSFQAEEDNLVFSGDLVNKGPGSIEVLDTLIRLRAKSVRGNHDDAILHRWHAWHETGTPLKPQHAWLAGMQPRHVEALDSLPFTISIPSYGITVVHAGLAPDLPLRDQDPWAMYKMRNLAPASDDVAAAAEPEGKTRAVSKRWFAVEKDKYGGKAWGQVWQGPSHVFFGHDAKRRLQLCPVATGLDTSCVYGFHLTAAVIPPRCRLESPAPGVSGQLGTKLAAGLPITREDLGAVIVSVQAARAYLEPSAAAAAGPGPDEISCIAIGHETLARQTGSASGTADISPLATGTSIRLEIDQS